MWWSLLSEQGWLRSANPAAPVLLLFPFLPMLASIPAGEHDNLHVIFVANSLQSGNRGQNRVDVVRWD